MSLSLYTISFASFFVCLFVCFSVYFSANSFAVISEKSKIHQLSVSTRIGKNNDDPEKDPVMHAPGSMGC